MTMTYHTAAAIFDMDGLLINSEPLWQQAEVDILSTLGVDTHRQAELPNTLGLRIDQVVRMWYHLQPWQNISQQEVCNRIIQRAIELIREQHPLLPGVHHALQLCRQQGLKIGLASASPLFMLQQVLAQFELTPYFDTLTSAEALPYSKPHPEVYLLAAESLQVDPLHCVALEDSFNGMIAGKAARMRTIVVPDAPHFSDARWALSDVKLASLEQLTAAHLSAR